ncbi:MULTISPECIES: hypothetical protein [Cupriavidus]|uniref:hypothetical protein n=1 Tax=Cupriavidus sp. DF5525 TaxID=3160989 RepID=UPI0032DECE33
MAKNSAKQAVVMKKRADFPRGRRRSKVSPTRARSGVECRDDHDARGEFVDG